MAQFVNSNERSHTNEQDGKPFAGGQDGNSSPRGPFGNPPSGGLNGYTAPSAPGWNALPTGPSGAGFPAGQPGNAFMPGPSGASFPNGQAGNMFPPPPNRSPFPLDGSGSAFAGAPGGTAPLSGAPEIPTGGTTGQITRVISARRSTRRQWRIFEIGLAVIVDALLLYAAFSLAYYLRYKLLLSNEFIEYLRTNLGGGVEKDKLNDVNAWLALGIIGGGLLIFIVRGLYSVRLSGNVLLQMRKIVSSLTFGLALLIAYYFVFRPPSSSRLFVPFVWGCAIVVLCLGRIMLSLLMGLLHRLGLGETRLLVVGSGRLGKMIMQHIVAAPNLGYSIVGFLHDTHEQAGDFGRFRVLGTLDDLAQVIRAFQVDEVIIALPSELHQQTIRSVRLCERLGASFMLVPELYELNLSRIDMMAIEGIPLLGIKQKQINPIQRAIMRATDIAGALLVLILGSLIWLGFAALIKLTSPGEVVFSQPRVGAGERLFNCYKFRSMYKNAEQMQAALMTQNEAQGPLFKMKDDPRVTPIGKFLRRTSLDEIPQLFNVLKGDMSLVGPRPPLLKEVAQYEDWQKGRLAVKPGLTGLWQVRGRSDLSFDEGVLMDLYYIENWSLRLYYHILMRTVPAVLFSRGAY
ncbi:MAG TPA: exopolysaccharide biosynthesis polyprenyl glycosylphosphotransferase [Ktedonobacteraceae bacterium]